MNRTYCRYLLPPFIGGLACGGILSIVIAIKFNHLGSVVVAQIGFCAIGAYLLIMLIVGTKVLSEIWETSCNWLWELKCTSHLRQLNC